MNPRISILAALAVAGATGCFFTTTINSPPQADVNAQPRAGDEPHRGATLTFSAAASADPDGDELSVTWQVYACEAADCDPLPFATRTRVDPAMPVTVDIPIRRADQSALTRRIEVHVEVEDEVGATHADTLSVDILNRPPTLDTQLQGYRAPDTQQHPLGATVRVLAIGSDGDDGGALTYQWELVDRPVGAQAELVEVGDDAARELTADVEGGWQVEVTVRDGEDGATAPAVVFFARDRPPCITGTQPQAVGAGRYVVDAIGAPRRFGVSVVQDDLDFWPARVDPFGVAGTVAFRWSVATPDRPGELVELPGHALPDYTVDPALFSPGDRLALRVEIDDRAGRAVNCDAAEPTCSIEGDGCLQRVTWEVEIR